MEQKARLSVATLYGGLFLLVIFLILMANIFFLTRETKRDFIKMFWRQNGATAETIALSAAQAIASAELPATALDRYLTGLLIEIDRPNLTEKEIILFRQKESLVNITLLNNEGQILASAKMNGPEPEGTKAAALARIQGEGSILFALGPKKLLELKATEALSKLVTSIHDRNIASYVRFIGADRRIIADSDNSKIGTLVQDPAVDSSLQDQTTFFFRKQDLYEAVHPFELAKDRFGVVVIGMDSKGFDEISQNIFDNTAVFSLWVMAIAIALTVLAVTVNRRQEEEKNRMQRKMAENAKLVSLGNLAAGVAHEVRNPLNSISMTIQRLQIEYAPEKEEEEIEFNRFTSLMLKEVTRINEIITDFLGFARPYKPSMGLFSTTELLTHCFLLYTSTAEQKDIKLVDKTEPEDHSFYGDQKKLTQVLINLVKNAVEASEPGSAITLESETRPDGTWVIWVKDQGKGISKEKLNHLFDIYYTTKENGTGLGLFISRKIVKAHGGEIVLQPGDRGGMTARLTLPKNEWVN